MKSGDLIAAVLSAETPPVIPSKGIFKGSALPQALAAAPRPLGLHLPATMCPWPVR
jgi:hypothetical protein